MLPIARRIQEGWTNLEEEDYSELYTHYQSLKTNKQDNGNSERDIYESYENDALV